ncbi:mannosyltransferase [Flavobacteriaceae bacterium S0825]|uniref:mannosyltransferase n=1 Tax=Gaetbulibacter sp. S0825 TaxID=2720084 RepID=UPI00142FF344|nr:mannosyltransferase [Gaetbulibacter sp. S0825]MCK0107781.1 mannosyltransferase [Flavobacteriaceae bacterium S0825]NIX63417.1 mannosyltransferase [Gaetbulibacter sp. S0825]
MQYWKLHKIPLLLSVASILFYFSFAYDLVRTDYIKLIGLYTGLFFLFYKLVQTSKHNLKLLTWIAFGFRAIFILAIPNLSQDFYRFIWDGRMILEGFNPYLFTPESFITNGEFPVAQAQELYAGMGSLSAGHYTNYPPLKQLCFVIAGLFSGNNILGSAVVLRLIIIATDFGTFYFGKKLLKKLKLPIHNILWYILNPFIIIELTGNLHFEGVMIFFLVWSLYLLHSGKWKFAAVVFACSVSIKLIPLLFLPLFYQWFTKRDASTKPVLSKVGRLSMTKLMSFYVIVGATTILLFLPFYSSQFITNYAETIGLWFQNFEFNGSMYYLAREIGYLFRGYNEITIIGTYTAIIVFLFVVTMAFLRKNSSMIQAMTAMLFALSFYYFTATTVHPWYVATLLILSIFTKYKFPLVWSFVIVLSYLAYLQIGKADKVENLWIIVLEYCIVYGFLIWELFVKKISLIKRL